MVGKEGGHKIQQMVFGQFDKSMREKKEYANCYQQQEADIASERVLDSNTKLLISFLLLLYIHLAHTHSDTHTHLVQQQSSLRRRLKVGFRFLRTLSSLLPSL